MTKILYYLFLKPLSLLPLSILYILSDVTCFVMYRVIGYRKKVVFTNLRNSFPEKTEAEITKIAKGFYSHLCDIVVESVRIFSISKEEALRRCVVLNPEVADKLAKEGRSIVFSAGHYLTWEMAATSFAMQFEHWPLGLIAPVKNKFLQEKIITSRTKYGTGVVLMHEARAFIEENKHNLIAPVFIGDQAPSSNEGHYYWTTFLNQETPVMLGTEKYAKQYDWPVIFLRQRKVKRGYYTVELVLLEENPQETAEYEITEKHTRFLEGMIMEKPEYWLWSHKRWKRKRPA